MNSRGLSLLVVLLLVAQTYAMPPKIKAIIQKCQGRCLQSFTTCLSTQPFEQCQDVNFECTSRCDFYTPLRMKQLQYCADKFIGRVNDCKATLCAADTDC